MTYFCFVDLEHQSTPHMEPLEAVTLQEARDEALRLLDRHESGTGAHVFAGDERVISLKAKRRVLAP